MDEILTTVFTQANAAFIRSCFPKLSHTAGSVWPDMYGSTVKFFKVFFFYWCWFIKIVPSIIFVYRCFGFMWPNGKCFLSCQIQTNLFPHIYGFKGACYTWKPTFLVFVDKFWPDLHILCVLMCRFQKRHNLWPKASSTWYTVNWVLMFEGKLASRQKRNTVVKI